MDRPGGEPLRLREDAPKDMKEKFEEFMEKDKDNISKGIFL